MSLTSILTDPHHQPLRDRLKTDFINPGLGFHPQIQAAPLTANCGIVGTAFDYLLRFHVERINSGKRIHRTYWVADVAFFGVKSILKAAKGKKVWTGFVNRKRYLADELLAAITRQYWQAKENYSVYQQTGEINDEVTTSCLFLAKLDLFHRAGIIDHTLDDHHPEDIRDLMELIDLVNDNDFMVEECLHLNPNFGECSNLVCGADADLIIDRTLIDVKCTKHFKLVRKDLNQVMCYYVLSLIEKGKAKSKGKKIDAIGLYFARYGLLWKMPIADFGSPRKLNSFKRWFVEYLDE